MFDYLRQRIGNELPQNITSAILPTTPLISHNSRSAVGDEE